MRIIDKTLAKVEHTSASHSMPNFGVAQIVLACRGCRLAVKCSLEDGDTADLRTAAMLPDAQFEVHFRALTPTQACRKGYQGWPHTASVWQEERDTVPVCASHWTSKFSTVHTLPHVTSLQGRLYLKKATVVDVHQPTVCDVVVDDPRQRTTGVTQRQLETLVPKVNLPSQQHS